MEEKTKRMIDAQRSIHAAEWERADLPQMSDKELAVWHSKQTEGKRGDRLAEYEWQRRISETQIKAAMRSTWIGVWNSIFCVVLGVVAALAATYALKMIENQHPDAAPDNPTQETSKTVPQQPPVKP